MTTTRPRLESAEGGAFRAGFASEHIFNLTKIDRWFLVQIKEIVDFEEELAGRRINLSRAAQAWQRFFQQNRLCIPVLPKYRFLTKRHLTQLVSPDNFAGPVG